MKTQLALLAFGLLSLSQLLAPVQAANASEWREFWVNEGHSQFLKNQPFSARVSFTDEGMSASIGLPEGATYAAQVHVEFFKVPNTEGCPGQVYLMQKYDNGGYLQFPVAMTYDARENKCWGKIEESTGGTFLPQGGKVTYFQNPIILKKGQSPQKHVLVVRSRNFTGTYDFSLADSIR